MEKKLLNNELPIYDWMFVKYGLKVTGEPMDKNHNLRTDFNDVVAKYYIPSSGLNVNKSNYMDLKKDIRKYSNIPALKNYLHGYYVKRGKNGSAKKILRRILKDHPDYAFGKTALLEEYVREDQLVKAEALLPENFMDIHVFFNYPSGLTMHESTVRAYFAALTSFYCAMNEIEPAKKCHRLLYDLNKDHAICGYLAEKINMLKSMFLFIKEEHEQEVDAKNPTVIFEQRTERPVLNHDELYQLYEYDFTDREMTNEVMDQIMALPRETLISDLEQILMDSIYRFDYWEESWYNRHDNNDLKHDFYKHAIYFLGALKATESKDVFLNVFRQGEERLDFLFGDFFGEMLKGVVYFVFKDDLNKVLEYIKEPNQYCWSKILLIDVLTEITQLEPHRREECVTWHEKVAQLFLEHRQDETLFDTMVTTHLINMPYNNGYTEMLPLIKMLFDEKIVSRKMFGDYNGVEEEVKSPFYLTDLEKLPRNIYEFYSKEYSLFNQELNDRALVKDWSLDLVEPDFEDEYEEYLFDFKSSPFGGLLDKLLEQDDKLESIFDRDEPFDDLSDEPAKKNRSSGERDTFVKQVVKTGRNDSCLCGSGKKYKKCCMNK